MFKILYLTLSFLFLPMPLLASESQISTYPYEGITVKRHHYPELTSTQDKIKEDAHQKSISPNQWIMITTDSQTAGRGMWGRSWNSPPGNVFVTYGIFLDTSQLKYLACLSWISGVALTRTLESFGLAPKMRWINNAIVNDKKIGGILCDAAVKNRQARATIGIGINVNMTEDQCRTIDQPATSLSLLLSSNQDVNHVLSTLTSQIYGCFYQLSDQKVHSLFEKYSTSVAYVGEEVQIYDGKNTYQGIFKGLTPSLPDIRKASQLILVDRSEQPVLKSIDGQTQQGNAGVFYTGEIVPRK